MLFMNSFDVANEQNETSAVGDIVKKNLFDSGGIRTHAIEMTGALNQRLRPIGHANSVFYAQLHLMENERFLL